ncbi:hypothetical protein FHS72_000314 [Loktanella ponticola]|uniref:DUF374 domain-containing protein n=1 Tax=Yoonia ponticola TaxID=1524255 RepID=A0A7W9BHU7_9RHOB|nr:DUF374 domain-containing protein [Yoonia ponticola]MBB5720710.1 hypothetical protein [Yoonia ponticola]
MSNFRRRLEKSPALARVIATLIGWYLRLCIATSKWDVHGVDALEEELADGPVLCALWHGRLLMIAPHWPRRAGSLSCLHDTAPIGRAAGALQAYFGLQPIEMSARRSNVSASRVVMKRAKEGVSIGITADGPTGPGFAVKDAPLEWARIMQRPIYGYAFATKRHRILKTWDSMIVPLPFTRGAIVFDRLDVAVPRKATDDQIEAGRNAMTTELNRVTALADQMSGVT